MTEFVNLVVDGTVLLNIGIRRRDIRLRLVVIIIGNKILNRVLGEELLEFFVELCSKGLVVHDNKGRTVQRLDDVCHREGLTGAGNAEESLELVALLESLHKVLYRLWLVAGRSEFTMKFEAFLRVLHECLQCCVCGHLTTIFFKCTEQKFDFRKFFCSSCFLCFQTV